MTQELLKKPSTLTLQEAQEAHDRADLELKTVEAQARAAMIRQAARPLLEGYDVPPTYDEWAHADPVDRYQRPRVRSRSLRRDRREGAYFPAYETEVELSQIRADARLLAIFDSVAVGALGALTNYVIGKAIQVEVEARRGVDDAGPLADKVQTFVDQFLQDNKIPGRLDREIHTNSRIEGETLLELYVDQGHVLVDQRDPEELTEPANKRELEDWLYDEGSLPVSVVPSWKFGILTDFYRTQRAYGYHLVRDDVGNHWDFVPASNMVHIKRNAPAKAKRGVTDLMTPGPDLDGHGRLKRNVVEGSAILAAIAFIREHVSGHSQSDIESLVSGNATAEYQRSSKTSTKTVQVEQMRPGTIKDIPAEMKYHASPLGSLNHPVFLQVAQHVLRIAGLNWSMPEYIISGDASNANFASTLVAESPFVKAREADQGDYGAAFEEMVWKAVRIAHGLGYFGEVSWDVIWGSVSVNVVFPEVASRDKLQQAQVNEILSRHGIISAPTWATQMGLDYDEEVEAGATPEGTGPTFESGPDYRRVWGL